MYYAGTSFAAPVMSVIAALRLTHSAQECPFNQAPPVIAAATYPDVTSIPRLEDILQAAGCP
jgi:hypothetical protein